MQVVLAPGRRSWAFTSDTPYAVYALSGVQLRLVDDHGGLGLWPRRWFRVVDPRVAPGWRLLRIDGRADLHLGPVECGVPGYFEHVFERAPGADLPIRSSAALSAAERARFTAWFQRAPWARALAAVRQGMFAEVDAALAALTPPVGPAAPPEAGPLTVRRRATSTVPNLTPGRLYGVLELLGTRLRLIGDDGAPALFPWADLEPHTRALSPAWQVQIHRNGTVRVAPEALAAPETFASLRFRAAGSERPLLELPDLCAEERERFARWFEAGTPRGGPGRGAAAR